MKAILPSLDFDSTNPLYLQLYTYIKNAILNGEMLPGEKLPSLRRLAKSLDLSLTTISLAYNQLLVEGYIMSKPQSGFYVEEIAHLPGASSNEQSFSPLSTDLKDMTVNPLSFEDSLRVNQGSLYYDLSCFDFVKWKKCMNKVLNDYPHMLLSEGEPKGEVALRYEISKYVYQSRGVICTPDQIVIGAGTQQITNQLCTMLDRMNIKHVALEDPGYLPVRNIFRDRYFAMTNVPVGKEGIHIHKLPSNIPSAVYVSPSNQFPTGYVMPIGKRHELLYWANENDSIIIEDDYDSELRYFGRPIPSLQGLDKDQRVVYLGSFSSTLFPSIKISYMILPERMVEVFDAAVGDYTQTCSKTEQLTLAIYMEKGYYRTNIKKLRNLYAQKLSAVISAMSRYGSQVIRPINSSSGINMLLTVNSSKTPATLSREAAAIGISALPIATYTEDFPQTSSTMIFYYNQIPLGDIDTAVKSLVNAWKKPMSTIKKTTQNMNGIE